MAGKLVEQIKVSIVTKTMQRFKDESCLFCY